MSICAPAIGAQRSKVISFCAFLEGPLPLGSRVLVAGPPRPRRVAIEPLFRCPLSGAYSGLPPTSVFVALDSDQLRHRWIVLWEEVGERTFVDHDPEPVIAGGCVDGAAFEAVQDLYAAHRLEPAVTGGVMLYGVRIRRHVKGLARLTLWPPVARTHLRPAFTSAAFVTDHEVAAGRSVVLDHLLHEPHLVDT